MNKRFIPALLLGLASLVQAAPAGGELWEMQVQLDSPQFGRSDMPSQRICQPPKSARETPQAWMAPQAARGCGKPALTQSGDSVRWEARCEGGQHSGEIRFIGTDRMEGRMQHKGSQGEFTMTMRGRKVGDCRYEAGQ